MPVNAPAVTKPGSGTVEWETPPELYDRLNRRFQFDYDAFASHENALCERYSTSEGTFHGSDRHKLLVDGHLDGLHYPWTNARVFMNPPYSREITKFIQKAVDERENAEIIVALLPAATETKWFQQLIFPFCHIDWLPQRVRFIHPPFRCFDKKGEPCAHELGKPGPSPTTGFVIATFKSELLP